MKCYTSRNLVDCETCSDEYLATLYRSARNQMLEARKVLLARGYVLDFGIHASDPVKITKTVTTVKEL